MWGIPAAIFLVAFFHRVAPGVMARELMQSFHATGTLVGLLSATYFYAYAGLMVPGGLLVDAFGARRVVAVGGAVMGAGTIAMGLAATSPALFAGRFAVGAGASVVFVGTLKIAAAWFPPERFATLTAVTATVGILGSLVATVPLAALVERAGWRGAFWTVGVITLVAAALCAWIVRDAPDSDAPRAEAGVDFASVMAGTWQVLSNRHTWPPFLAFFFLYSGFGNLLFWGAPYVRDVYGLSSTRAAAYAAATSVALLASGPLTGFVSDRVVRRRKLPYTVLTLGAVVAWSVFVLTLGALPLGGVYGLFFTMGLLSAAFVLTWPIGREVNPPHLAGVAVAVVNLGGFVGAALTQGVIGAVLDARWSGGESGGARVYPVDAYRAAFAVCALFVLAGALVVLAMRETRGENIFQRLRDERPGRDGKSFPSRHSYR